MRRRSVLRSPPIPCDAVSCTAKRDARETSLPCGVGPPSSRLPFHATPSCVPRNETSARRHRHAASVRPPAPSHSMRRRLSCRETRRSWDAVGGPARRARDGGRSPGTATPVRVGGQPWWSRRWRSGVPAASPSSAPLRPASDRSAPASCCRRACRLPVRSSPALSAASTRGPGQLSRRVVVSHRRPWTISEPNWPPCWASSADCRRRARTPPIVVVLDSPPAFRHTPPARHLGAGGGRPRPHPPDARESMHA
jgi:hypothetical protein